MRTRPHRPRQATRVDGGFYHAGAQEISRAFGEHDAFGGAGFVAHAAHEIAKSKAQRIVFEVGAGGAVQNGLELANTRILPTSESEVFPRRMAGRHRP